VMFALRLADTVERHAIFSKDDIGLGAADRGRAARPAWPDWLTAATEPWPGSPAPHARQDPARVHAVLTAPICQTLHLGEIADVLGWTTARIHAAADHLATRIGVMYLRTYLCAAQTNRHALAVVEHLPMRQLR
jgi:hypothetical protein